MLEFATRPPRLSESDGGQVAGGSEEYVVCVGCGDIDLIVVTDDDYMPRNYKENMQNYLKVSSVLRETRKKIPIDLIVHTRPMHEKFIKVFNTPSACGGVAF